MYRRHLETHSPSDSLPSSFLLPPSSFHHAHHGKNNNNCDTFRGRQTQFFFQVAEIQELSSRLEVQNNHLSSQLQTCERTRGEAAAETAKQLEQKQKAHDDQVE